jgi:hypothetical protein
MDKAPWSLFGKNFSGDPFGGSGNPFANPFAFGGDDGGSNKSETNEEDLYLQILQRILKDNKGKKVGVSLSQIFRLSITNDEEPVKLNRDVALRAL